MAKRTDKDMELSGQWTRLSKVHGKSQWLHESGETITYDCMAWGWKTSINGHMYPTLQVARVVTEFELEKLATQSA